MVNCIGLETGPLILRQGRVLLPDKFYKILQNYQIIKINLYHSYVLRL